MSLGLRVRQVTHLMLPDLQVRQVLHQPLLGRRARQARRDGLDHKDWQVVQVSLVRLGM